ncbi:MULTISPECIES: hypothetical protein [Gordonia]|uniref:hypothetical protein n=1 Tax=Gordonia TaxID=2053 RepID=UPI003267097A
MNRARTPSECRGRAERLGAMALGSACLAGFLYLAFGGDGRHLVFADAGSPAGGVALTFVAVVAGLLATAASAALGCLLGRAVIAVLNRRTDTSTDR